MPTDAIQPKFCVDFVTDSNLGASGSSSPSLADRSDISQQHLTLKSMLTTGQMPKISGSNFSTTVMGKNTLFDEGLRIAQQYGLGDFAQELKSLQGTPEENEGHSDIITSLFASGLLRTNEHSATNGEGVAASPKPIKNAVASENGHEEDSSSSPAKESCDTIDAVETVDTVESVNGV